MGAVAIQPLAELRKEACSAATIEFTALPNRRWDLIEILDGGRGGPVQVIGTVGVTRHVKVEKLALQLKPETTGATDIVLRSVNAKPAAAVITNQEATQPAVQWHVEAGPWFGGGSALLGQGIQFLDMQLRSLEGDGSWWWQLWPASRPGRLTFTLARFGDESSGPLVTCPRSRFASG